MCKISATLRVANLKGPDPQPYLRRDTNTMYNQHKILRVLQLISILKSGPPKSVRFLAQHMDCTDRTLYRYLALLEQVGFALVRDNNKRISIVPADETGAELGFTSDENALMKQLLLTAGKQHPLSDGIIKKLYVGSELKISGEHLLKAHLGQIVETLSEAILQRRQVLLRRYHSLNSGDIRDRLVEPIRFTENYRVLAAYEVKSGKNKFFNIERISSVDIGKRHFEHSAEHHYECPDVFGYAYENRQYPVELQLSLKAAVLLKEAHPMCAPLIKQEGGHQNRYRFKATVHHLEPVTRFVLANYEDVRLLDAAELKSEIRERLNRMLENG